MNYQSETRYPLANYEHDTAIPQQQFTSTFQPNFRHGVIGQQQNINGIGNPGPLPPWLDASLGTGVHDIQFMRYKNNENPASGSILRHILTHFKQMPEEEDEMASENVTWKALSHPMSSKADMVKESSRDKQIGMDQNGMGWRKQYYGHVPASSSSSESQEGSVKVLDLSSKRSYLKRKLMTYKNNDDNIVPMMEEMDHAPKKAHLQFGGDKDQTWVKKGVIVKSILHGTERPIGTIVDIVNDDKNACILQLFMGWRVEVLTKFIAPVKAINNQ